MPRQPSNFRVLFFHAIQFVLDLFLWIPGWAMFLQWVGVCKDRKPFVNPDRLSRGLVVVLSGVEGPSFYAWLLRSGLRDVPAAVVVHNWAGWIPGVVCAISPRICAGRVRHLLAFVRDYRRAHPGRPVVVIGHSGGAAMAIHAAEVLGPDEALDGVIALATPLSPGYDLSRALAGVKRALWTAHSPYDFQLAILTAIGGNFDRVMGTPAGRAGFLGAGAANSATFRQICWERSMAPLGHLGGHVGWASPRLVEHWFAPAIRQWLAGDGMRESLAR